MQFIRKHKKLSIVVMISLVAFVLFSVTFGRYIYNVIDNYILETKGFYFNSSVLSVNTKEIKMNNWDGSSNFPITIDLNNRKNSLVSTEADIEYQVGVKCSSGVTCTLSSSAGTLMVSEGSENFNVEMKPNAGKTFGPGDTVTIEISVTSLKPYKKTIKGKFIIGVENKGFSYSISDAVNDKYLTLDLTNSVSFYEASEAFSIVDDDGNTVNFAVGDIVSSDIYGDLSENDKEKCFSAIVNISFDPSIIYLDMTANSYLHRVECDSYLSGSNRDGKGNIKLDDGYYYVEQYCFKINATSSESIIFYKADKTKNYTYPIVNDESLISVNADIAEITS